MNSIAEIVDRYISLHPHEKEAFALLLRQLAAGEEITSRRNFTGHVTASGLVLSEDYSHVLLIHHRFLDKWLQPGGHMEPSETSPLETAKREVREETGIGSLRLLGERLEGMPMPIRINSHAIPARPEKNEPAHWHHDFCYAFQAMSGQLARQREEVNAAEWVSIEDPRVQAMPWMQRIVSQLRAS